MDIELLVVVVSIVALAATVIIPLNQRDSPFTSRCPECYLRDGHSPLCPAQEGR